MSQRKVDQYKEFKKNREKIYAKQKRAEKIRVAVASVLAVAVIGWFGFSIYNSATRPDPNAEVTAVEVDYNDYMDYISGLTTGY